MATFTYFGPVQTEGSFGSVIILTTGPYPASGSIKWFSKEGHMPVHNASFILDPNMREGITAPEFSTNVEISSNAPIHVACYEFEIKGSNVIPIAVFNLYEHYLFPPQIKSV